MALPTPITVDDTLQRISLIDLLSHTPKAHAYLYGYLFVPIALAMNAKDMVPFAPMIIVILQHVFSILLIFS